MEGLGAYAVKGFTVTTIIIHKGALYADRKVCVDNGHHRSFFKKQDKIMFSPCGRVAVCWYGEMPSWDTIDEINNAMYDAVVTAELNGTWPVMHMRKDIARKIPENIHCTVVTRKHIATMPQLGDVLDEKFNNAKGNEKIKLVVDRHDPVDFLATGSGSRFAMGVHYARPKLSMAKLYEKIGELDGYSSSDFTMARCRDMKPIVATKVKKK